ncbi:hypothetical protein F5883DRAFT_568585 [Diaporthe sp. PMI_573]|nr:hypothetical protein F5883DRAFT_568585 [Diaporthaceae sp. PMI_573]
MSTAQRRAAASFSLLGGGVSARLCCSEEKKPDALANRTDLFVQLRHVDLLAVPVTGLARFRYNPPNKSLQSP